MFLSPFYGRQIMSLLVVGQFEVARASCACSTGEAPVPLFKLTHYLAPTELDAFSHSGSLNISLLRN
jgi:hypothetical protein